MKFLTNLLKTPEKSPSHEEIKTKVERISQGVDRSSLEVHSQKTQATVDLKLIQKQARVVKKEAEKLSKIIDTAYAIAKATGNY